MGKKARVPFRRKQLGRALRRMREEIGMTQEEAGAKLVFSAPKICRIESGQLPGYHEFRAMLDVYGLPVNEWQSYVDRYWQAKADGWWRAYGLSDQGYVSMEDEARSVREFQPGFVPGLLQTEPYARAIFASSGMPRSKKWMENDIAVRMRRQERITADPPLRLGAIIDESVLRQRVAPDIMRDQIATIAERAQLETISVQILLRDIEPHDGQYGHFIVLDFPDAEDEDLAYVEHAFGSVHIEDADEVRAAKLRFDQLSGLCAIRR